MTNTVSIDSMIFVWGIKKIATPGQEANIQLASDLLDYLDVEDRHIVLPTPIITEIMCPIVDAEKRSKLMDTIQTRFRVAPLDDLAAYIAGEIWAQHKSDWQDIYKTEGEPGIRNKFKYDILILGISISKGVDWLYTEDQQLYDLATACKFQVRKLAQVPKIVKPTNAGTQTYLPLDEDLPF